MPLLAVVRHAKSDWSQDLPDDRRPLNLRGRETPKILGKLLGERFSPIDVTLCSPAVRARETLELSGLQATTVRYDERIYAATHEELAGVLEEVPDDAAKVLMVGHNPGLSDLVRFLTGQPVEMKTAAFAILEWDGGWADVWSRSATLVAFETPRP